MHTVIIGSGVSGLSSAILLAEHGHKVTILEAAPHLAPLLRGFSRDGLRFDTGFHYSGGFETYGILSAYCKLLGIWDKISAIHMSEDCCELFRFYEKAHNGTYVVEEDICLPFGYENIAKTMEKYFPGSGTDVRNFIELLNKVYAHSNFTNFTDIADEDIQLMLPDNSSALGDFFNSSNVPEQLRAIFFSRCELFGTPPHLAALSDFSLVAAGLFNSAHTVTGGGLAIAEAFTERLAELEITSRCSSVVVAIESETVTDGKKSHKVRSVLLKNGERIPCDTCIYTGHPKRLPALLSPGVLRPSFVKHMAELPEGQKAFMLFGSTESDFLDNRIVHLYDSSNISASLKEKYFSPDSIYLYSTPACNNTSDRRRSVMAFSPVADAACPTDSYHDWKREKIQEMTKQIQSLCPELHDFIPLDGATPRTMEKWIHGSTGSIYGLQHQKGQLPLVPRTKVEGLAMAGQSVILPGLLGAMVSAAAASGLFIGYPLLFNELRACSKIK